MHPVIYRIANESDAPAMGRVMVDTYMAAHKGQMPEGAWLKRKEEWTHEVSANAWARSLREIADDAHSQDCIYVAVDELSDAIVGLVMGGLGDDTRLPNCGEIYSLYVHIEYQGRGVGRQLLQAAVLHLAALGKTALMIGCLNTNAPASGFYASLGGQVIGTREDDDEGFKFTVLIFGWEDLSKFSLG
jgi:ribosomal protein S18 acetylase RimI-like enzyme